MWSSVAFSRTAFKKVAQRFSAAFAGLKPCATSGFGPDVASGFSRTSGLLLAFVAATTLLVTTAQPRFFPDDPIWIDDDKALDASKAGAVEDSNGFDFVVNTFVQPGEKRNVHALDVNTVDDAPDSSWFTNRIGRGKSLIEEIGRGPDSLPSISLDGWVVAAGKSTGVQPGFRVKDPKDPTGRLYQIEFDPPSNPEMASGAEIIGTAFYHAFGYHTVDVYIAELDPAKITIAPGAKVFDPLIGEKRALTTPAPNKVY